MAAPRGNLLILYASQTGTAQDVAERFAQEASRRLFTCRVAAMDAFDVGRLPSEPLVIFFVSTTGDGEMPDNGKGMWRFLLRADLPKTSLAGTTVAVFGLGDSSYTKFNAAARKLHTRLAGLGARQLCERGLGDDQSPLGVDGDYDAWTRLHAWPALDAAMPVPDGAVIREGPQLVACRYHVRRAGPTDGAPAAADATGRNCWQPCYRPSLSGVYPTGIHWQGSGSGSAPASGSSGGLNAPFPAVVVSNTRITAPGWSQDVRHVALDINAAPPLASGPGGARVAATTSGSAGSVAAPSSPVDVSFLSSLGCRYRPGDVAVIYPRNTALAAAAAAAGETAGSDAAATSDAAGAVAATDDDASATGGDLAAVASALGVGLDDVIVIETTTGDGSDDHDDGDDAMAGGSGSTAIGHPMRPAWWASEGTDAGAAATSGGSTAPLAVRFYAPTSAPLQFTPAPTADTAAAGIRKPASAVVSRPLTVRELLDSHLDMKGTPRRGFFALLSFFAADEEQREKLVELSSPAGADLYHSYCARERRTYAEVLLEFASVRLPLAYLLEFVPPLLPRQFSIASAPLEAVPVGTATVASTAAAVAIAPPSSVAGAAAAATTTTQVVRATTRLELCVGVVEYKTKYGRKKRGVCSAWVSSLTPGTAVYMHLRQGAFAPALEAHPSSPLIMVGPGTGIAPMRSLVRHWHALAATTEPASPVPPQLRLYGGCRHADKDWIYGAELQALATPPTTAGATVVSAGTPGASAVVTASATASVEAVATPPASPLPHWQLQYRMAFSRDVAKGAARVYVQHLMEEDGAALAEAITGRRAAVTDADDEAGAASKPPPPPPASVFISGSAKRMPADVAESLRGVLQEHGGMTALEATKYVAGMERGKRLVVEAWS